MSTCPACATLEEPGHLGRQQNPLMHRADEHRPTRALNLVGLVMKVNQATRRQINADQPSTEAILCPAQAVVEVVTDAQAGTEVEHGLALGR